MQKKFQDQLRAAREKRELSQSELATRTGLQPSAVSHFETGKRSPSFDNLKRLADALGVSVDYLLGRAESPAVSSPAAEQIFRDFTNMTAGDQEALAEMAAVLAKKNQAKNSSGE